MGHVAKRRKSGHHYSDIHTHDNARLHLGDFYQGQTNNHYYSTSETTEKSEAILESLKSKYDNLDTGRESLPEAACNTLQWLFEAHSPFESWLRTSHDEDLFWIDGKPGSGKSTLMRFIAGNERTLEALQQWAGTGKVLTAHHFFWHPGNAEQRTVSGLLRNLLHQLCQADPDLVSIAFEPRWERERQYWTKPWLERELWASLRRVQTAPGTKVCLIIDGLDESQPQDCHVELSTRLLELSAMPNFKLCVSSRPWQAFLRSFERLNFSLKLEAMIEPDITIFARDRFLAAERLVRGESREKLFLMGSTATLSSLVASRAQGIFLWARSIVNVLCEHIATGATDHELYTYLLEFPTELEDYYRKMIYDRIHGTWRSLCASFLKLALMLAEKKMSQAYTQDWRIYWVAESLQKEPTWRNVGGRPNELFSADTLQRERQLIEKRINASCGGLLCMYKQESTRGPRYTVDFAHGTVVKFLETQEMREVLSRNVPSCFLENDFIQTISLDLCKLGPSESDLADGTCYDMHQTFWGTFKQMGIWKAPRDFEAQLEQSAIFFHDRFCVLQNQHFQEAFEPSQFDTDVVNILKGFLYCSHFQYANSVIRSWPGSLAYPSLASRSLELALAVPSRVCYEFIKLLLEHGADIRCCTPAWTNFVMNWAESRANSHFDEAMWKVAQLLVQHGACLVSLLTLQEYSRCQEIQVVLAACVPEEALDQLYALLDDTRSPEGEQRIASTVKDIRNRFWPAERAWQSVSAQKSLEG
jgi:hypothetical protein